MHILIVGSSALPRGVLIDRILAALEPRPRLYGYRSVKEEADGTGRAPIYLYPVEGERRRGQDNLLGWCREKQSQARPEAFERGACLIEAAEPDGLLVMDEIGPMESGSPRFCAAVKRAVKNQQPRFLVEFVLVLAALRNFDASDKIVFFDSRFVDIVPDIHTRISCKFTILYYILTIIAKN